ncbi:metal-dependent transcriptional regulator [Candidatus Villigracilis affinis]|uniref:metal-dependent transcriptional regulator n=1 Tax=Candidatus Villigracilis affinis TaxID=3140682 RepID=UPI001DB56493|nr:metal-dependent transcriptional regulator [Anaerolineales bacterium]
MTIQYLSESTEMYLKAMLELSDRDKVAVGRLAERLSVTPVSANEMVRRLSEQGLMAHTPYKGVALTTKGTQGGLQCGAAAAFVGMFFIRAFEDRMDKNL